MHHSRGMRQSRAWAHPGRGGLSGPEDLTHWQLIRRDWRERRPRGNHPPCHGRLRNGTLAARLPRCPSPGVPMPRTRPEMPERESATNIVDAAALIPSTDSG